MVQLIMVIAKVAWLAGSYSVILSFLTAQLPALIAWCVTVFSWFDDILPFIVAAVGTCRWLIGNVAFNFALVCWLMLPPLKTFIYFFHQAATFGGTSPHSIKSDPENTDYKHTDIGFTADIK